MKRGDGPLAQVGEEVDDVRAVVAAEDPVLVLNRDQADVAVVDELSLLIPESSDCLRA